MYVLLCITIGFKQKYGRKHRGVLASICNATLRSRRREVSILLIVVCVSMLFDTIHGHIFTQNTQITWNHKYLERLYDFGGNKSARKCRLKPASPGKWAMHGFWQSRPQAGKWLQAFVQQGAWGPNELTHCRLLTPIWRQGSWSTLVQVMACCLTAPSHYLNHCWLIISKV